MKSKHPEPVEYSGGLKLKNLTRKIQKIVDFLL